MADWRNVHIRGEPIYIHLTVLGATLAGIGAIGFAATIFAMLGGVNASLTGIGAVYMASLVAAGMVAIVSGAVLESRS